MVRELDIPVPFTLERFLREVGQRRGRPIRTGTFTGAGPGVPCGLWIRTTAVDYIYSVAETTAYHRQQIILHEVAHMLLGHGEDAEAADVPGCALPPGSGSGTGGSFPGRGAEGYRSEEEQDAENLASLIQERADTGPSPVPVLGPDTGVLIRRHGPSAGPGLGCAPAEQSARAPFTGHGARQRPFGLPAGRAAGAVPG
jgi:hypothetical protein